MDIAIYLAKQKKCWKLLFFTFQMVLKPKKMFLLRKLKLIPNPQATYCTKQLIVLWSMVGVDLYYFIHFFRLLHPCLSLAGETYLFVVWGMLQMNFPQSVSKSTNFALPASVVFPHCGRWAMSSSILKFGY